MQCNTPVTEYTAANIGRTRNEFQDKPKYGPFTKEEFQKKCADLGISELGFSLTDPANLY
jgi:hypothetical protein